MIWARVIHPSDRADLLLYCSTHPVWSSLTGAGVNNHGQFVYLEHAHTEHGHEPQRLLLSLYGGCLLCCDKEKNPFSAVRIGLHTSLMFSSNTAYKVTCRASCEITLLRVHTAVFPFWLTHLILLFIHAHLLPPRLCEHQSHPGLFSLFSVRLHKTCKL